MNPEIEVPARDQRAGTINTNTTTIPATKHTKPVPKVKPVTGGAP